MAANRFQVDVKYWGKAAHLWFASLITSPLAALENLFYGPLIESTEVESPLFVLGSWRSGTTHLHNLLCQDDRFAAPDLFQTMYPHTFRIARWWWEPLLRGGLPKKRFMDNVEQGLREPAEDEMALAILSQRSSMLAWTFPRRQQHYESFLTFEHASPNDRSAFQAALQYFVAKVQQQAGLPLVLKSPQHTARAKMLLEQFPDAKFVHIHRHPYDVYRSMMHMVKKVIPVWALQQYDFADAQAMVIRRYRELYQAYLQQRDLIPAGRLHEVSYELLSAEPLTQMQNLYEAIDLPTFEHSRPALTAYLDRMKSYQKNRHADLAEHTRELLHDQWGFAFDAFGYDREQTNLA